MNEIKDINLTDVVQESAKELIIERRKMVGNQIKQLLQRVEGLARKIVFGEKEIKKLKDKLTTAQTKIDRLKAGDWSVLEEPKFDNSEQRKLEKN